MADDSFDALLWRDTAHLLHKVHDKEFSSLGRLIVLGRLSEHELLVIVNHWNFVHQRWQANQSRGITSNMNECIHLRMPILNIVGMEL